VKEIKRLPKEFLVTVIHSIVGDPFKIWVKNQITERNTQLALKKDKLVSMDPGVAEALRATTQLTSGPGNTHNMLKESFKRKRSKVEMAAFRAA